MYPIRFVLQLEHHILAGATFHNQQAQLPTAKMILKVPEVGNSDKDLE